MTSKDWAPKETASIISTEQFILVGHFIGAVGFGIHLTLFVWCFNLLYFRKRTQTDRVYIVYICVQFIVCNIGNATGLKFATMAFVNYRDYPGGPAAFYTNKGFLPISQVTNVTLFLGNWLQDGLLLYRFWIFYDGNWYLFALPATLFAADIVLAVVVFVKCNQGIPVATSRKSVSEMGLPFWLLSITINIILVILITGRLLYMRRRLGRLTGKKNPVYLSITAMLVESAAIFILNAICGIIPSALHHPSHHLAVPLLGQTQAIAPLLVIIRVARRRARARNITLPDLISANTPINALEFHYSDDDSERLR